MTHNPLLYLKTWRSVTGVLKIVNVTACGQRRTVRHYVTSVINVNYKTIYICKKWDLLSFQFCKNILNCLKTSKVVPYRIKMLFSD